MRNVWKGLIIGGLTGAAAGMVLDGMAWGAGTAAVIGDRAIHHAPDVAARVRETVGDAVAERAERVQSADLPGRLKGVTEGPARKVREAAAGGLDKLDAVAADGWEKTGAALGEAGARARAAVDPASVSR
jgi:hypothetical protein